MSEILRFPEEKIVRRVGLDVEKGAEIEKASDEEEAVNNAVAAFLLSIEHDLEEIDIDTVIESEEELIEELKDYARYLIQNYRNNSDETA